jgi:hypothetical protein
MKSHVLLLSGLFLSLSAACGQAVGGAGFNRPPAGVDEALRARVEEFYKLEMAGRFRQAEGLVCEDSKDRYYDAEKRRWSSVEILQTTYEPDFAKGRVTAALGTMINTMSGPMPVKAPVTSLWRLEKGLWCRYIPDVSQEGMVTPFGVMKPAPDNGAPANPFAGAMGAIPTNEKQLEAMVKLSRNQVSIPASGGSETVEIFNGMPGNIEIKVTCPGVIGLECELAPAEVPKDGKASLVLKFTAHPDKFRPPTADVRLLVEPIGVAKTVRIQFQ